MNEWVGACVLGKRAFALSMVLAVVMPGCVLAAGIDVSQSGSPSYSYSIATPPGAGGLQPQLSLNYTGERQGIAGVGWSLGGVSVIARCAPSKAVDGAPLRVNYNDADKLCLDGQRLIQTDAAGQPLAFPQSNDAAPVASNGVREFRLELDSNTRIRAYGSASTGGPAYFKIIGANGQVREYGAAGTNKYNGTPDPVIGIGGTSGMTMIWPLVRVTDASGNWVQFTYSINAVPQATYTDPNGGGSMNWPAGSEWLLSRIDYAANYPTRNSVVLTYADRGVYNGDRALWYASGMPQLSTKLLSKVETFVVTGYGDVLARRTKLQYGAGPTTNRSILSSISECTVNAATTEVCLPPTSFAYSPGNSAMVIDNSPLVDAAGNANGLGTIILDDNPWTEVYSSGCNCSFAGAVSYGMLTGDFNGDGRIDLLRWSATASENRLFLSEGVKNYKAVPVGSGAGQFNVTDSRLKGVYDPFLRGPQTPDSCVQTLVLDLNRDGRDDLLVVPTANGPDAYGKSYCPAPGGTYMYLSNGDGSFNRQVVRDAATQQPIALNRTPGVDPVGNGQYISGYANYVVGDFDGDGFVDILALTADYAALVTDAPYPGLWCLTRYVNCSTTLWLGNGDGTFRKVATPGFGPIPSMVDATLNGKWVPYIVPASNAPASDFKGNGVVGLTLPAFVGWPRATAPNTLSYVQVTSLLGPITNASLSLTAGSQTDPCAGAIWLDFNGDGWTDALCRANGSFRTRQAIDANGNSLWLYGQTYAPSMYQYFSNGQFFAADIDGDGRTDLMVSGRYYRSLGNGGFSELPAPFTGSMDNNFGNYFKNFLGTGATEYLATYYSQMQWGRPSVGLNTFYSKVDPMPPDQLVSVTSSTGAKTTIGYTNLSNSSVFASDMGTAKAGVYPVLDFTPSMNVVSSVTTDSGVGTATVQTRFGYAGSKVEINGRGFLGFREIRQQADAPDGTSKLTSVKQLVQKHPYIGSVAVSETYQGPLSAMNAPQTGTLLSRVESTYCDTYAAAGAENSASFSAPCPVSSKLQRPYLFKSVQSGVDLAGYATPTTTTTQSYVGGYLSSVLVQTQGNGPAGTENFSKQTGYLYFPDDISGENWKVGRVQKSTTSSTVPNSLSAIPTTAGNQPKASATTGQ